MQTQAHSHFSLFARTRFNALVEDWSMLRGTAAILFGLAALAWPGLTLVALIILFGGYALLDGIFAVIAAAVSKTSAAPRWWLTSIGLTGGLTGFLTLLWPAVTAFLLLYFIAAWAVATGTLAIVGGVTLRDKIEDEWLLIFSGAVAVLFGVLVVIQPGAGAVAMIWIIGGFAIVFGILQVMIAMRLRRRPSEEAAGSDPRG
jgi:uncharacterized membrane protein HdeD (DUF308 family)